MGRDRFIGGSGADTFQWFSLAETGLSFLTTDRIFRFSGSGGEGDVLDVFGIDANPFLAGDQGFNFVGSFSGTPGEAVITNAGTSRFLVSFDPDGDAFSDGNLLVDSASLTSADFIA